MVLQCPLCVTIAMVHDTAGTIVTDFLHSKKQLVLHMSVHFDIDFYFTSPVANL